MSETKLKELTEFGQSLWLDNISRSMIENGQLQEMVKLGVRGLTSNPTIFDKAISLSSDYDKKIIEFKSEGKSTFQIYDALTIADVQDALDIFKPVYEKTQGWDGFVSLEIDPRLAKDIEASIAEGQRLNRSVNRPNLMIKVPATDAGFVVIEELLSEGINVNSTLIFSTAQYLATAEAFLRGMSRLVKNQPHLLKKTHSVASIFVSRLDTYVDKMLIERSQDEQDEIEKEKMQSLLGKAAVANSHQIFVEFLEIFSAGEFQELKEKGASFQRVLWASTSTKNPAYSDIKYVTELISQSTINTLPQMSLEAFLDHGIVREALTSDLADSLNIIRELKEIDIDVDDICLRLLEDGVSAFEKSFQSVLNSITVKSDSLSVST